MSFEGDGTRVVHAGLPEPVPGQPFLPGPVFAAPFHFTGDPADSPNVYNRYGNPTWTRYEEAVGGLEDAEAVLFPSGMATAMGMGDNTKASLITRGLAETARLGVALGADPMTFAGLAGLGDLVATCSSPLSRNRTFGEHLGRGESLESAQASTRQTAEGVKSCLAIRDLARSVGVEMPITEQVERVCHEGADPKVAVRALMGREMKPE